MFEAGDTDFNVNLYGKDVGETMYNEIRALIRA